MAEDKTVEAKLLRLLAAIIAKSGIVVLASKDMKAIDNGASIAVLRDDDGNVTLVYGNKDSELLFRKPPVEVSPSYPKQDIFDLNALANSTLAIPPQPTHLGRSAVLSDAELALREQAMKRSRTATQAAQGTSGPEGQPTPQPPYMR